MSADLFGESEEPAMPENERPTPQQPADSSGVKPAARGKSGAAAPPTAPASAPGAPRFEEAYGRLEQLVGEMERGDLPLEDLLARFEEGVKLVRHCQAFLKQAQLRVEQYVEQKDGQWVLKDPE
jgi:exodeoxyribonuclease VII small subunit